MNLIKPKKKFGQNFLTDKNIAEKIVSYLAYKKAKTIIEIGPGKVLSGLIKRINREVKIDTINKLEDIENLKI